MLSYDRDFVCGQNNFPARKNLGDIKTVTNILILSPIHFASIFLQQKLNFGRNDLNVKCSRQNKDPKNDLGSDDKKTSVTYVSFNVSIHKNVNYVLLR